MRRQYNKMRIEIPELKRCCFCLPLRRGLLLWNYLKVTVELMHLFFILGILIKIGFRRSDKIFISCLYIVLIVTILQITFSILLIISAHRKIYKHMKICYRYAIILLILAVSLGFGLLGLEIYYGVLMGPFILFVVHEMIALICFVFMDIVLQVYLVILVRSEMLKLNRSTKFEFINHTSEPQCVVQLNQ